MKKGRLRFILGFAIWFVLSSFFYVSANILYQVDLTTPTHQLAFIKVSFPKTRGQLRVNLPVWRIGKYQRLALADGIRLFKAKDKYGFELKTEYKGNGEWIVYLPNPTKVMVSYQLHANALANRVRHIDETHAFLDASGVFVYSPEYRDMPVQVALDVADDWKSYSGMAQDHTPHHFFADNYDALIDSPIETGINSLVSFTANEIGYDILVWGEGNYNLTQIKKNLALLSEQASYIWQGYPFQRYLYMLHATSGIRGATEHINSSIIQVPRFKFKQRQDYLRFMATASHEFIHAWNVKAYRPKGLVPYHYQNSNISELLWMVEGSTSYFQYQLLLKAGIVTLDEFLADLAKRIEKSLNRPGREVQSIAEASQRQWESSHGDYAINHGVSIYSEGYMTSWALDFNLLSSSKLKSSYRDVHRLLYRDYALPKSYDVDDVQKILFDLTGKDYQGWWRKYVNSPIRINYRGLLKQAGLKIDYGKSNKKPFTGLTLNSNSLKVATVLKDSPAWQAGINVDDELVAINGLKITYDSFNKRISDFKPNDKIKITLFKNDSLAEKQLILGNKFAEKLTIKPIKNPTNAQKQFFVVWLGIDWPFEG